jgi:cysteine dioxygenase
MQTEGQPLPLDRFLLEISREPVSTLAFDRFVELGLALDVDDALVRSRIRFCEDHYARNLVCRTPDFELLVLCWKPGQESTIHDHAGSLNVIRIYEGTLTSRFFERVGGGTGVSEVGGGGELPRGPVRLQREEQLDGGHTGLDRGGIHQLANTSDEALVTVHLYSPPLQDIVVYATDDTETSLMRLRYSLADDFA